MAGDWIAYTKGLSRKPEVLAIAERTGRDRRVVACLLLEFWEWADGETEDGLLPALSVRSLSAICPDTDDAFWRSVVAVGWLVVKKEALVIPNFRRWMGASAKRRLKESRRKQLNRASDVSANGPHDVRTKAGPEYSREEYRRGGGEPPHPPVDDERRKRFGILLGEEP